MKTKLWPRIYKIEDNADSLDDFQNNLKVTASAKEQDIIFHYPTVYIHNWQDKKEYEVYIGESNNVIKRTRQHYENEKDENKWQSELLTHKASLYIIGHEHFNKSLTLDIENRLMHYMMSVDCVKRIHNMRTNPQNKYYPDIELNEIFRMVWDRLRRENKELFPNESAIRDSAVFKASPLHKLTPEQEEIREIVLQRVTAALEKGEKNQIIFVEGEAGTGKTVLNSSIFYEMFSRREEEGKAPLSCYLMVNHDEQITVYKQIAQKLGLTDRYGEVVCKPTTFINHNNKDNPVDVAFIDEAHLLLTQGKQSYQGTNQLQDIVERAKVIVVMFDENQILTTEQYWEAKILHEFKKKAKRADNYFQLKNQLRIHAPREVIEWIDDFTKNRQVHSIPQHSGDYEIKIFKNPEELDQAIQQKAKDNEHRLSRLIASYDWAYNRKSSPQSRWYRYWEVLIGKWHKPWNRELEKDLDSKIKRANKTMSWAEQPHTIDEVGSTFTIQGFDLNYAGVILGPSVKYRDGKIVFDPESSANKKAVRNRTLSNGSKEKFGEILIQHEVRVLMTRGVEGLFIYACDEELRQALLNASMHMERKNND